MVMMRRPTPEEFKLIVKKLGEQYPLPYRKGMEGAAVELFGDGSSLNMTIQLLMNGVSEKEVRTFETSNPEFGLYVQGNLILICGKAEGPFEYFETPFCITNNCPEERKLLDPQGKHYIFGYDLVDISTNTLRGMRVLSMSPEFSKALYEAVKAQALSGVTDRDHSALYQSVTKVFETKELFARCRSRCKGGS